MAEPFFRMMEILVPSIVAANGNKITFEGLENIPERGGALIALNHTSYVDWVPASIAAHHRRRRLRFMIKAEMQDVRAVNYVIKHAQLIPVDRSVGADAYAVAVQRLRAGNSLGYTRGDYQPQPRTARVQDRSGPDGAGGAGADYSHDRLGRAPDLAQGSSKEPVPQQDSDRRGDRIAGAAGGQCRAAQCRAAPSDECDSLPRTGGVSTSQGEHWVPRRLGGGAPTVEESRQLRIAELAKRRQKRGYDGVTSSRRSQVGPH